MQKDFIIQKLGRGAERRTSRIDGGMCETCHEVPGYIVHHKEELTPKNINNSDVALNFDNLKYDCHICHNKENKQEEINGLVRVEFDEEGNVICQAPPLK